MTDYPESEYCWQHRKQNCPYCDKCEHGKGCYQQCYDCNPPDDSWKLPPITDSELEMFKREVANGTTLGIRRDDPRTPRNYVPSLYLFPKLIAEYERLRKGGVV